jgi:hypothetical protein
MALAKPVAYVLEILLNGPLLDLTMNPPEQVDSVDPNLAGEV